MSLRSISQRSSEFYSFLLIFASEVTTLRKECRNRLFLHPAELYADMKTFYTQRIYVFYLLIGKDVGSTLLKMQSRRYCPEIDTALLD